MNNKFDYNDLFILDMANNHQGSLEHGKKIIKACGEVIKKHNVKTAFKFQFRNLDTFIHPDYLEYTENKHIKRFRGTGLSLEEFSILKKEIIENGMITICTPFDEESVDNIMELDFDIVKVASCSADDWPLLEKISQTGKPVVCSTAGLNIKQIDNIVSFFEHRGVHFAIMHCIAIYPTPEDKLELNQIGFLKKRYPQITIGFSTHEEPNNFDIVKMAFAKGARIFERHVGLETDEIKLNAYSSNPEKLDHWIEAYKKAVKVCGVENRSPADRSEMESLHSLKRGVFATQRIKKGEQLNRKKVFFAIPLLDGQLISGEWNELLIADKNYDNGEALSSSLKKTIPAKKELIYQIIHEIKGMLNESKIVVGSAFSVELSHHYGIERFREIGATIIDCINREYCKKLIVLMPSQKHPYHYHKKKEETFQVLSGEMVVELAGKRRIMYPGDTILVQPGVWHKFESHEGVIFEEISTTHYNDDSFYEDKSINQLKRELRKTKLINWGRHQFD